MNMEVLAKLGIDWKLLLAQAVNFLILLWVLRRFAYRPMLEFLEKRTKRIEAGLRDAKVAEEKLRDIEGRERDILEKAKKEASDIVNRAREVACETSEKLLAESRAEAGRLLEDAHAKLEGEAARMKEEIQSDIADLVLLATEKVLKEKLTAEKDAELVQKAVKEL